MASNVIYADFPAHRDIDIIQTCNRIFSPYQAHTQGQAVGLFQGHSDPSRELERLARIKGRCPTPESW
jgi:hypothetical protein